MIDFGLMLPAQSAVWPREQPAEQSEPERTEPEAMLIDFGMMTSLPAETPVPTVVHTMNDEKIHTQSGSSPLPTVSTITVSQSIPAVQQTVTVTPAATSWGSLRTAFVAKPDEQWGWDDLRDYVLTEIEKQHGPQPRDSRKEAGIFKSFMTRYPDGQSVAIARAAFEVHHGMWRSAPISVQRFCMGSDPYFANVIAERI